MNAEKEDMMTKTASIQSFSRLAGYSNYCFVCPFCGQINDDTRTETRCSHYVRQTGLAYHEIAVFNDGSDQKEETK